MAKNILILTPYLNAGGLERMILALCKGLSSFSDIPRPRIFVFEESSGTLAPEFAKLGVPVEFFEKGPGFSFDAVREIRNHCRKHDIGTIHTHDLGALIYGVFAKILMLGRLKVIHTQHSFVHLTRYRRYRWYEHFFTYFANRIVCVSPNVESGYHSIGIQDKRLTVIENGAQFPEPPKTRRIGSQELAQIRSSLLETISNLMIREQVQRIVSDYWVVMLARLGMAKGQAEILKIWQRLDPDQIKNCTLIFVGQESEIGTLPILENIRSRCPAPEKIIFAGASIRPDLWLRASHLYVSGSQFEGLPLGPLEALGSGLPLFLSNIPGHQALKGYAELFDLEQITSSESQSPVPRKLTSILDRIRSEGDSFYQERIAAGKTFRDRYGFEKMAEKYAEIYRKFI